MVCQNRRGVGYGSDAVVLWIAHSGLAGDMRVVNNVRTDCHNAADDDASEDNTQCFTVLDRLRPNTGPRCVECRVPMAYGT
jgi:hypothetical protein